MRAIGVRDLKAHLSRYLREVSAGEVLLVTDRGRVVAELRAPGETDWQETDLDRRLRRLGERAPLAVGAAHDPEVYRPSPVRVARGTARALLAEEREER